MRCPFDAVRANNNGLHVTRNTDQITVCIAGNRSVAQNNFAFETRFNERVIGNLRRPADMEGTHGQLGARLTDGLRRNDTDSLAHIHRCAAGQIPAIAATTYTILGFASEHRTDLHFLNSRSGQRLDMPFLDHGTSRHNHIAGHIREVLGWEATQNARGQIGHNLTGIDDRTHNDAVGGAAIADGNDRILRDVNETTGQVTGIGGLQRRICKTLTGAMGRVEVFEHVQTFFEV